MYLSVSYGCQTTSELPTPALPGPTQPHTHTHPWDTDVCARPIPSGTEQRCKAKAKAQCSSVTCRRRSGQANTRGSVKRPPPPNTSRADPIPPPSPQVPGQAVVQHRRRGAIEPADPQTFRACLAGARGARDPRPHKTTPSPAGVHRTLSTRRSPGPQRDGPYLRSLAS